MTDRPPLRDHSPNIDHRPTHTPKIKSAMLPLNAINPAQRAAVTSASRKSPRSRITSKHRLTPYSTSSPSRQGPRANTLKNTAL